MPDFFVTAQSLIPYGYTQKMRCGGIPIIRHLRPGTSGSRKLGERCGACMRGSYRFFLR